MADPAYGYLPAALEAGQVSEEAIDACVRRVLRAKLQLGLFDNPYVDEDRAGEVLADPAHREVARVAAERSAVLLRNEGGLLPLSADRFGSIAVIGPLADSPPRHASGRGSSTSTWTRRSPCWTASGSAPARTTVSVDYAPGIRPAQRHFPSMFDMFPGQRAGRSGRGLRRRRRAGQRAVDLAAGADVAVVVVGEWQNMIGEAASRSSLELPGRQLELLQAVVGDRHAGRAAGDERPAAGPALGRRERTGDPGHLVSRHPAAAPRSRTCSSATSRPAASCRSAGRGPSGRCR